MDLHDALDPKNHPCSPAKIDWLAVARKHVHPKGTDGRIRCLRYWRFERNCDCRLVQERGQLRVECSLTVCEHDRWVVNQALAQSSYEARRAARCASAEQSLQDKATAGAEMPVAKGTQEAAE